VELLTELQKVIHHCVSSKGWRQSCSNQHPSLSDLQLPTECRSSHRRMEHSARAMCLGSACWQRPSRTCSAAPRACSTAPAAAGRSPPSPGAGRRAACLHGGTLLRGGRRARAGRRTALLLAGRRRVQAAQLPLRIAGYCERLHSKVEERLRLRERPQAGARIERAFWPASGVGAPSSLRRHALMYSVRYMSVLSDEPGCPV
jgi:hypothetical protein